MRKATACILLAAGGSTRLGSPKQLIEVDGEPLVARVARQLIALGAGPVGVVVGGNADAVRPALSGVAVIENDAWSRGMGTSIRAGVVWARSIDATHGLIALCDQPDVDVGHLRALLAIDAEIVATAYDGALGVPAVFAASTFDRLATLPDDRGAKAILNDPALAVRSVACEAARVDLDTPADVARWRAGRGKPASAESRLDRSFDGRR